MKDPLESKIFDHYTDAQKRISGARYIYERNWFRNVLYLIGIQWIKYSPGSRRWMQKELKPWVPKPVTNKFATHATSMQQTLTQRAPSILCIPGSQNPSDKASADQANRFLPAILKEAEWDEARRQVVPWMCLTGNAFLHVYYDNNPKWGTSEIEGQKLPKGRLRFETFSPFEIYIDPEVRCMEECEDLIVRRRYPVETIKKRWGVDVDPLGPGGDMGTGLTMLKQIAYASGTGEGMLSSGSEYSNSSIIDQFWKRPCEDFPKGAVAVFANGNLLNADTLADGLPYLDKKGNPIWPWHQFVFDRVPGRIYGRTPLDDVAPKQEQRNKLESLIQLIISRSASPGWLIPKGAGIGIIGGEPGFQMEYNPLSIGPGGAIKPERIPGDGVQTSLIAWLEKIDKDMEELAGCVTGDTEIPCLDGKTRTMKDLAESYPHGGMWVYGFDRSQMRVVPAEIKRAWKTKVDKCVRVSFVEGTHVDCTADHPFLTWDRGYVRADELLPDEPIVPLIVRTRYASYLSVVQPIDRKDEQVHRMVAYALMRLPRGKEGARLDVHHLDSDPQNNLPDNLQILTRSAHLTITPRRSRRNDPEWQSEYSKLRWGRVPKEQRSVAVNAMLAARNAQLESATPEMLSSWAKKGWETRRANHRVLSVVPLDGEQDVYDLTTSVHNFGTSAGVFVHNTFEVLKGQAPPGVTAGTALRLLLERAVTRFTPVLQDFETKCASAVKDALSIFQQLGVDSRTAVSQGDGATWEITQFSNADINGNVDVIVESGSAMPQSTVGFQALIQDLAGIGMIDPRNPETRYKIVERFGVTDVLGSEDANVKQAERENYRFVAENRPPVVNPAIDSHPIHIQVHTDWALTSEFEESDPVRKMQWIQHIAEHKMLLAQSMAPPPTVTGTASGMNPTNLSGEQSDVANEGGNNSARGMPSEPAGNEEPPFPGVM